MIGGASAIFFYALKWGAQAQREAQAQRAAALRTAVEALCRGGGSGKASADGGFVVQTARGVAVSARHVSESEGPGWLEISASADIPTDLVIARESIATRIGKVLTGPDIECGDEELDRLALLRGSEARLLAMLDAQTRTRLSIALREGDSLADGRVVARTTGDLGVAATISEPAKGAAALAEWLSQRASRPVPVLLRENAMGDPVPAVRRRCLEVLTTQFEGHKETQVALDAASVDHDASVRLFAATRSGGAGSKLEALAELVLDLHLEPEVRVNAMKELVAINTGARVIEVAERRLEDRNPEIRKLAIGVVGRARRGAMVPTLIAMAERALGNGLADELAALADAFRRIRDPAAEPVLLEVLAKSPDPAARLASVLALSRVGSVAAVPGLRAQQGLLSGEMGRAAEEAVAAIQARARHASEGQLAVHDAPGEAGRVSVAPARGAVSVPDGSRKK